MDVFLLLVVVFGLLYVVILGARWAFHIDKEEARKRERLSRKEARRINDVFEDIAAQLRKPGPKE